MAPEHLPAITLTDPYNHDAAPSPAQSPTRDTSTYPPADLNARVAAPGRPSTPSKNGNWQGNGHVRPESAGSNWPSPSRLIRTLSSNGASSARPTSKDESATGKEVSTTIDPLSQHLLKRAKDNRSISPAKVRIADSADGTPSDEHDADHSSVPNSSEPGSRTDTPDGHPQRDLKKGVKAVAFLSRLMHAAKKKDVDEETLDDVSSNEEQRPEGNNAEVFAQSMDNMGFSPNHAQPPAYIKVRSRYKKERDFDRLFLAQELHGSSRPKLERRDTSNRLRRKVSLQQSEEHTVWAMEFSRDGKYLAAAGADMVVRIWAVLTSLEDRHQLERQESKQNEAMGGDAHAEHLSAPVFQSKPYREYEGHTATILDLSWSKNNFLLTSSMDKTVRLWHISRAECLCTFKHNDFVPSISFHPKDDRFFLAGSLDSKLRLWSIPDKSVAFAAQLPDMITAVAFTPDGKYAMAGCLSGLCMFYETEGLKYQAQIHVRSTRGHNAKGSKITGIKSHYGPSGDVKVLVTSNDSRIRLYNFRDKSLELKFRGNENNVSQIRAAVSDDGKYVYCGSEDRMAYVWSLDHPQSDNRDKTPVEMFEAHDTITTAVCMAPTKTRLHLGRSEDPLYDLCNPPPGALHSQSQNQSQTHSELHDNASRTPTDSGIGSRRATPSNPDAKFDRAKETPQYLARSTHRAGHIIVTADYAGKIKVFRQDCAWAKRHQDEWDKSSIFTKRSGKLSRTASFATRGSQRSLGNDGKRYSTASQAPSERIVSWRNGVATYPGVLSGLTRIKTRSISPRRSIDRRSVTDASSMKQSREELPPAERSGAVPVERSSLANVATASAEEGQQEQKQETQQQQPQAPVVAAAEGITRSPEAIDAVDPLDTAGKDILKSDSPQQIAREMNPLSVDSTGVSYTFWDLENVRLQAEQLRRRHEELARSVSVANGDGDEGRKEGNGRDRNHLAPEDAHGSMGHDLRRTETMVSKLTDELSGSSVRSEDGDEEDDVFDDAREE